MPRPSLPTTTTVIPSVTPMRSVPIAVPVAPDLQPVLERAASLIMNVLGVERCHIYKLHSASRSLELVAGTPVAPGRFSARSERTRLEMLALDSGQSIAVNDLIHDPRFQTDRQAAHHEAASGLAVVIAGETAPFGVCSAYTSRPHRFYEANVQFVESIVTGLTEAFRNARLSRDRARFAAVATTVKEAVVELTLDGTVFGWNAAAEALYGYAGADIKGRSIKLLFADGGTLEPAAMLDVVKTGGAIGPIETTLRRRDGSPAEVELHLVPIRVAGSRVVAASLIARDLTHQRQIDRELQIYGNLLNRIPTAVVVWRLEELNDPSSLRLVLVTGSDPELGIPRPGQIGELFEQLCPGEAPTQYADVARTGVSCDCGERRIDNRVFRLEAFALPDRAVGVVWYDVTEKQLLIDRLEQAQRMELVGRLASGVAHDFNNLLTIITSSSELIQSKVSDPTVLQDALHIDQASQSAGQLASYLLRCGRPATARLTEVDLSRVVRNAEPMLRRIIGSHIRVIVLDNGPVLVRADAMQVERVLVNLFLNARDAMPGYGQIFVESSRRTITDEQASRDPELRAGDYGVLQVIDTGSGLDPATARHIFTPFFTTRHQHGGTGLGLSIVGDIVNQAGGFITVKSEAGDGTTFTIYIPALDFDQTNLVTHGAPVSGRCGVVMNSLGR